MDIVGKHQVDVLVVLAGEHGIESADLPWEEGHAFVFGRRTIQGYESKEEEIGSLHQLRYHDPAIVGGERRVVDVRAVIVPEAGEAGILDAVALGRRDRKDNAFR